MIMIKGFPLASLDGRGGEGIPIGGLSHPTIVKNLPLKATSLAAADEGRSNDHAEWVPPLLALRERGLRG